MVDKEYVGREEVIKILEHYDLSSGSTLGYHSGAIECAISEIGMLPAADVVEVVRCKDCKHSYRIDGAKEEYDCAKISAFAKFFPGGHFCGYGERKTDG